MFHLYFNGENRFGTDSIFTTIDVDLPYESERCQDRTASHRFWIQCMFVFERVVAMMFKVGSQSVS